MLSIQKFERITGHCPVETPTLLDVTCDCGEYPREAHYVFVTYKGRQRALEMALKWVYDVHGEIAMKRAGYRCEECGGRRNLQRHHQVHRSKGRDDKVTNLILLCNSCHDRRHGVKR